MTLKIKEVRVERLVVTGQFENRRVGVTCTVARGDDPSEIQEEADRWVCKQLGVTDRLKAQELRDRAKKLTDKANRLDRK